jgi:hypothetical protein
VGLLVLGMEVRLVGRSGLDHFPEDLEQALPQTAQRASVALALLPFVFVVDLCPRHNVPGAVGPKINGVAEDFVALVPQMDFMDLA